MSAGPEPPLSCDLRLNHALKASVVVQEAQVLAHQARPRIGRPRQQGRAGGIGCMAYQTMARNCSEKNLNSGKIAATLSRAGQIIQRKSIDQREQTQAIEEMISNHGEHRAHGEGEHTRCSQDGRGNHAWGQTGSEIATRGSRLRAATLGSWPSLLVSEAERCVIASSTHPTGWPSLLVSAR